MQYVIFSIIPLILIFLIGLNQWFFIRYSIDGTKLIFQRRFFFIVHKHTLDIQQIAFVYDITDWRERPKDAQMFGTPGGPYYQSLVFQMKHGDKHMIHIRNVGHLPDKLQAIHPDMPIHISRTFED
ncbi:hypothetical protein J416_11652 [Gracilibacillus halophilus YIM-C55.5]|uniref:Bacterial Pleckstrin homology domain-containing protein n=1 Tax=Gracilibacillus halophilus YIM-C55.5 TaxID=1308866 RepID=N4WSX5_9BACI|nr:hypothetical protein [Gracilibacillus halophilus]ENH96271.1 hypothetical protein J416_11652 [Gracilibacillus halophilus YIM-C55.5]